MTKFIQSAVWPAIPTLGINRSVETTSSSIASLLMLDAEPLIMSSPKFLNPL